MDHWIVYSLLGGTFFGIGGFYYKVVAHKTMNKNKVMWYANIPYILLPLFYFTLHGFYLELSVILLIFIILRIVFALEKSLFIIESLKYIESSIFFPVHKIIQIFASFLVGMFIFGEYLSYTQILALFVGGAVVFLLSTKQNRNIQVNYKTGIWYLLLSNLMILFSSSINKYMMTIDFDLAMYLFLSGIFGAGYISVSKRDVIITDIYKYDTPEFRIGILKGCLSFFGFICFLIALGRGPFALVQLVNLSSVLIPIILSILIFKEKINIHKVLAFILFGFAVYLINM